MNFQGGHAVPHTRQRTGTNLFMREGSQTMPSPAQDPNNTPGTGPEPGAAAMGEEELESALAQIDWAELQDFFLSHLGTQLSDMDTLLRKRDTDTLTRIGHSLKGSGGGVQLPRFTELGAVLEVAGKGGDLMAIRLACLKIREEYLKYRPQEAIRVKRYFES
jgi:HPt (histidine-containing phosphotransfer) domain-containing protein